MRRTNKRALQFFDRVLQLFDAFQEDIFLAQIVRTFGRRGERFCSAFEEYPIERRRYFPHKLGLSAAEHRLAHQILARNAGVATMKPFLELTSAEWHRMVDVNFNSLYYVTHALIGGMVERKRGFVVTIGSLAGRNTFVGGSCYAATKHAVNGFTESLMLEVRDANVRVAVVMPGSVDTALTPSSPM